MKNKKALSTVIATVLLILLVTASIAIVWAFVKNIVSERTEGVQSCFEVESSEKVTLNNDYTCFNFTNREVQFYINIGDVELDGVLISILAGRNSKSFTLPAEEAVVQNLKPYKGITGDPVKLPGKNEGNTYIAEGFEGEIKIDWIKIAPIVDEKQCGITDTILDLTDCSLLVN